MFSEKKCHFPNHVHEVVAGAAVAFALALALVFAGCVCFLIVTEFALYNSFASSRALRACSVAVPDARADSKAVFALRRFSASSFIWSTNAVATTAALRGDMSLVWGYSIQISGHKKNAGLQDTHHVND
jgi:hypothetical protein